MGQINDDFQRPSSSGHDHLSFTSNCRRLVLVINLETQLEDKGPKAESFNLKI